MSTRRIQESPSLVLIENLKELNQVQLEIQKMAPKTEVSVEGLSQMAHGKIVSWDLKRKIFSVRWEKKPEAFAEQTESQTGLRAFFKCTLFSTQLFFKTTVVRRLEDGTYHYRIPGQIFKHQKRGALRVPLLPGTATFHTAQGNFELIDLSISGAKLKHQKSRFLPISLTRCELVLNGRSVSFSGFEAKITRQETDFFACKFQTLPESVKTEIKLFLIEALRTFYEQNL
jgi:hypothetical protein